jgi:hypothetical protein
VIFKPLLCCKVLAGEKLSTRRPATSDTCAYEVAKDYAVQPGRGKNAIARMRVTHPVVRCSLGHLSDVGATREGFRTPEDFEAYWRTLYAGEYDPRAKVWLIHFELTTTPNTCPNCGDDVEWVLTPDERNVMPVNTERTEGGSLILSHRHHGFAPVAVPQSGEDRNLLRKQAATRGEECLLYTGHACGDPHPIDR